MSDQKKPDEPKKPTARKVVWTKVAEQSGAFSEHGQHKEGDTVETIHADHFFAQGWARPAPETPK
jgi:hypothetical protein